MFHLRPIPMPVIRRVLLLPACLLFTLGYSVAQHTYPGTLGNPSTGPATNSTAPATTIPTPAPQPQTSVPQSPAKAPEAVTEAGNSVKANDPVSKPGRQLSLTVSATQPWTETSLDLAAGDRVIIVSEGALDFVTNNIANKATPDGLPRSWREVITALPVNNAGVGALIGRLGNSEFEVPFLVGSRKEISVPRSGRLYLGINQAANETGTGAYKVTVQVVPGTVKSMQANLTPAKLPSDIFDKIPRRIADKQGNPGDMVNFLIIGSEDQMEKAFADAGWVEVDKTKTQAALHAMLSTYTKKAYTEMPMSELYLYGRPQDFGFARAEPVQVVQSRHHLRVWKAPFDIDGQPVWVGAATHDIGFEHDNRGQGALAITHKIDPDIDVEREFVRETLNATGNIASVTKVTPPNALKEARTATGGTFHSDGQVLVLRLASETAAAH